MNDSLKSYGLKADLNLVEGVMEIFTTKQAFDPFIILKGRDMLRLIARSVPFEQAIKVLRDDMFCEVVKCDSFVRNKEKFVKRRQRLIGNQGLTLKALEILTKC